MKRMNEQPDLAAQILGWVSAVAPQLYAPALSVAIAVSRVIYGGGSHRQMLLEGALCGFVTLSLVPALQYIGLPDNMATFAGGCVGFLGVEKLRELADKFLSRKAEGQ